MSVTVKVLSANKTLASHVLEKGKPLILNAKDRVNYELLDNETGFSPEKILTHRQGKDLLIALNDGDNETDVVIKNYFDGTVDNLLVGLHENGKMYAYVPLSAKPADAVSMLAEQATASQALGGAELNTAAWQEYAPKHHWLKVLAPFMFAGLAAAVVLRDGGDDDHKSASSESPSSNTTTDTSTNNNTNNNTNTNQAQDTSGQTNSTPPDTTAPTQPTASVSANGIVVSGKAEAGATVTVVSGRLKATGIAASDGNYSVNLPEALQNGEQVSVTATDAVGNVSVAAQTQAPDNRVPQDTTAPEPPTAALSKNGIVVSGKTEAGATVTVLAGSLKATGIAASDGSYSVNLPEALQNGEKVEVTATDAAGNVSRVQTFMAADSVAPIVAQAVLSADGKTVSGSTEASAKVSVNGATATADNNGRYSITLPEAQLNGQQLTVIATDKAGNSSTHTLSASDKTPPATPTATLSSDGTTVSGKTEAGAKVSVNGVTATADGSGAFSVKLPTPLLNKENITVIAQDNAGNSSSHSFAAADKTPPANPTASFAADGKTVSGTAEAGAIVSANGATAKVGANGNYSITLPEALLNGETVVVTVRDESGNSVAQSFTAPDSTAPSVLTANVSADGQTVSGSTEKNARVSLDLNNDGTPEYTTTADNSGAFSVKLTEALGSSANVNVVATDAAGNSTTLTVQAPAKDLTPPDAPTAELSSDGVVVSGKTEAGALVKVLANNQTHTATANEQGEYSITLPVSLQNGETISVSATDAAQNESEVFTFTAPDNIAPNAPIITASTDGSFIIILSDDAVRAEVRYTNENNEEQSRSLNKNNGVWELEDNSASEEIAIQDNILTLAASAVKDGSRITVSNSDAGNNTAEAESDFAADNNAPNPATFRVEDDTVVITLSPQDDDISSILVEYTAANGEIRDAAFTRTPNGWDDARPDDAVQIDPQTGEIRIPVGQLLGGTEISVVVSDHTFNTRALYTLVDDTPPADLVDIVVGNNDAYLTKGEVQNDSVLAVFRLPENGVSAGDVLVINGQDYVLEGGHINVGEFELTLPVSGDKLSIEAFIRDRVDANLVSGSLKKEYTLDNIVPGDSNQDGKADERGSPDVSIQDTKGSIGYINAEDINADGLVDVHITFPANSGYTAGDLLHISTAAGELPPVALTDDMIANGYRFAMEPSEGVNTVRVYVEDAAGNRSLDATDKSNLDDSVLLPPIVKIETGDDGLLSEADREFGTFAFPAKITIPAGYVPDSVLNITYPNGATESIKLSEEQIKKGVVVYFDEAKEGENTISATLTTPSGSVSRVGKDTVMGDFTAPAKPEVGIVGGEDGYLQAADLNENGKFSAKVMLPENGGYVAGDVLTISNLRGESHEIKLTDELIQELTTTGKVFEFSPVQHGLNQVRVYVKDAAQNTAQTDSTSVIRDNGTAGDSDGDGVADEMGKPMISFANANGDGEFSATAVQEDGTVGVIVKLSVHHGYSVGDVVHITAPDGTKQTLTISEQHSGQMDTNTFEIHANVRPVVGENTASVHVVDNEGNPSLSNSATATLPENTLLPPVLTVSGMGEVGDHISAAEYAANGNRLKAEVRLPITAKAGDKLTFTLNDPAEQTLEITLSEADVQAGSLKDGVGFAVEKDGTYQIYATTTNAAGEVSRKVYGLAVLDSEVSGSLKAEDNGAITVALPSDAHLVVLNVDGKDITLENSRSGNGVYLWNSSDNQVVSIDSSTTALIPADKIRDGATVSAHYTDFSGNTSTTSVIAQAGGDPDLIAPELTDVKIADDGLAVSGSTEAGATVTVVVTHDENKATFTASANETGVFSVKVAEKLIDSQKVEVIASDTAGNSSPATTLTAPDLTPPATPSATLSEDGLTVSGSAEAGAKVLVNGVETSANEQGEFSVNLPNALLNKENIEVIAVDKAGNSSSAFTFQADDKTAPVVSDLALSANGIVVSGKTKAGATVSIDYTGDNQADATGVANEQGAFSVNLPTALINGETLAVTAHDGKQSSEVAQIVAPDRIAPDAPTAALSEDGLTVSGSAEAGATVSANGATAKVGADGNYTLTLPEAQLNGETIKVTATDAAGNSNTTSVVAADKTAPNELSATFANDGSSVSGSTEANATVRVDVNRDGKYDYSALANAAGAYTIRLETPLEDGENVNVVAEDAAGNTSTVVEATAPSKDRLPPDAPIVQLSDDGLRVSGTAEVNAVVSLSVNNGQPQTTTANESGEYSFSLPDVLNDGQNISVTATDAAGNVSEATVIVAPDVLAPFPPVVSAEADGSITIILDDEAFGAHITWQNEQGETQDLRLTKTDGVWQANSEIAGVSIDQNTVTVAPDAIKDYEVLTATNADAKGNDSYEVSAYAFDHNPPAKPVLAVEEGTQILTITPADDASRLTVSYVSQDGQIKEASFMRVAEGWFAMSAEDGISIEQSSGKVSVPLANLLGDTEVAAVNTDAANFSTQEVYLVKDEIAPDAVKAILLGDNNNYLTANELDNEQVRVIILLPDNGVNVGDVLVVNGQDYELEGGHINTGEYELTLPAPAEGATLTIEAALRDRSGNVSGSLKQSYVRDTHVPGDSNQDGKSDEAGKPLVVIQDALGTSGYINAEDIDSDGKVLVNITFPSNSGYQAGDVLWIETSDGTQRSVELTDEMIQQGYSLSVEPSEGVNSVSAYVQDMAGNRSLTGSDKSLLDDSVALPPVLTLMSDVNNDGYLNLIEVREFNHQAKVKVDIPAGYSVGAVLNLTHANGKQENIELTREHLLHGLDVYTVVEEGENTVRATITPVSGSPSKESSTTIMVDTQAPAAPVVEIVGLEQGYFDTADLKDGKVQVKVSFPASGNFKEGDVLSVQDASGSLQTVKLTQTHLQEGVVVLVTPVEGENNIVATVSDAVGNESESSLVSGMRDNGVPLTPAVFINDNNDGEINANDVNADKLATAVVSLLRDNHYSVGDTLHLDVNGTKQTVLLTAEHLQQQYVEVFFVPAYGENKVSAYITDAQGNQTDTATVTSLENESGVYATITGDAESLEGLNNDNIAEIQAKMNDDKLYSLDFIDAPEDAIIGGKSADAPIELDMKGGNDIFDTTKYHKLPMQYMTLKTGAGNDTVRLYELGEDVNILTGEDNDHVSVVRDIAATSRVDLGDGDDSFGWNTGVNHGVVDGGAGNDTLGLSSVNVNTYELAAHFQNFERIVLDGKAKLSLNDKALQDNHAASVMDSQNVSYSNVLVIDGENGNVVDLSGISGINRDNATPINYNQQDYVSYSTQINGESHYLWVSSKIELV